MVYNTYTAAHVIPRARYLTILSFGGIFASPIYLMNSFSARGLRNMALFDWPALTFTAARLGPGMGLMAGASLSNQLSNSVPSYLFSPVARPN
jgi:hypothetical protein